MTSLLLFDSDKMKHETPVKPKIEWGTGKLNQSIHRPQSPRASGTFLYSGDPIPQNYENTMITLSNVRINDELVPAPLHQTNIHEHQIPVEFPSNHPYASHISEKAVFPTPSNGDEDRPSTYSDPYIVTHKCRSNPFRREVHYHGLQRDRHRSFKWPDKHYMQLPRSLSDASSSTSSFYPWPRKILSPNSKPLTNDERTTTMKNKEKSLLETTYQNDYCDTEGLGTHVVFDSTESLSPTEQLKPHFQKTFDPARPIGTTDLPSTLSSTPSLQRSKTTIGETSMATTRLMSKDESLDRHLSYGTDYVNLPAHLFSDDTAPLYTLEPVIPGPKIEGNQREIRYLNSVRPATAGGQLLRDQYASHQQMDAENRLHQLALIRPKENIELLNQKYLRLQNPRHARPILPQYRDDYVNTLYDQMGNYVQERSGLYHTDVYNPNELVQAIPELDSANKLPQNNNESYLDSLLKRGEHIQQRTKPMQLEEKAIGDYQVMRDQLLDKMRVPQDASTVDSRIQEGPRSFVQRETVYGQTYNTRKFLQENVLLRDARSDPTSLMSTSYNYNLERVRAFNSMKKSGQQNESEPQKLDQSLVSPDLYPEQSNDLYSTSRINEQNNGYERRSTARVYDSPFKDQFQQNSLKTPRQNSAEKIGQQVVPSALSRSAKIGLSLPGPEIVARQVESHIEPQTSHQHSYKKISFQDIPSQYSSSPRIMKTRSASLRSTNRQTNILDLQDQWSKSQAITNYHLAYPQAVPYVGDSTLRAKKAILVADTWAKQNVRIVK